MKKLSILLLSVLCLGLVFQSCNDGKTYAEKKKEEKEAIQRFIEKNNIEVISFDQFQEQDSTTKENQFVLFSESGVYMNIVQKGNGEPLEDNRYKILARYVEEQILSEGDSDTLSLNTIGNYAPHPDEFILTKDEDNYSASFSSGIMMSTYGSFVPSGWLVPFGYIRVGREISGRSKVRLIVPHGQGQALASSYVYPCYYEITYQLER